MLIDNLITTYQQNRDSPPAYIRNALAETLQYYLLQFISQSTLVDNLIFKGTGCLRIFFDLPHLSENLIFDWAGTSEFDIDNLALSIKNHFTSNLKFDALETKTNGDFQTLNIEFGVLDLFGFPLAPSDINILCVQLDITPAQGSSFTTEPAIKSTRDFSFVIKRYSLPDLMAAKIANILTRTKGRDCFDLIWFLEKGVTPNWKYLTELSGLTKEEVIKAIKDKVSKISNLQIQSELEPYFSNPTFVRSFCQNLPYFYDQYLPVLLSKRKKNPVYKPS